MLFLYLHYDKIVSRRGDIMSFTKEHKIEIINTILRAIKEKKNPYNEALSFYKISRQTIYKYIKELIEKNLIKKVDNKNYTLSFYNFKEKNYKNINLQEDIIYKNLLEEFEEDKKENVIHILTYSFTEILNNAIEHSESKNIKISYVEDYFNIYVQILDDGVGIFKKIKENYNLKNENEAIFELKKGKITSDPENHSGEGIFFSSKVVDYFLIDSYNKNFYSGNKDYFYHFEHNKKENIKGTLVYFIIDKNTNRTTKEVFDSYTDDDYIFNKTEITVHLAEEYLGEHLISRSIARRILSNIEKFKVIFLDFNGVKTIGQAFADVGYLGINIKK